MKILVTGDIHIGLMSSRLTSRLADDARASGVWSRIVDRAIDDEVSLVCLTGDIVDLNNRFWEAIGPLERGFGRLAEHGITTVAVAGNHDHHVLAQLADSLDGPFFKLLGRGGKWEGYTHEIDGTPALHLHGWSFPETHFRRSPLDEYDLPAHESAPTLGIIHGDLDVSSSPYATLTTAELERAPVEGWLLGHIHAPSLLIRSGTPFILYPGSPQALDPSETGVHGPWTFEVCDGAVTVPERIAISTVRYEGIPIDISGLADDEELDAFVAGALRDRREAIAAESGDVLTALVLRMRLWGRTTHTERVREWVARFQGRHEDAFDISSGNLEVLVDRVGSDVQPEIDIEEYSGGNAPPNVLADLLIDLDRDEPSETTTAILMEARREIQARYWEAPANEVQSVTVDDEMVRAHVRDACMELLCLMVEQTS